MDKVTCTFKNLKQIKKTLKLKNKTLKTLLIRKNNTHFGKQILKTYS